MEPKIILEFVGEIGGIDVPDIPLADGVDLSKLKEDEQPLALKIGKIGAISKNKARNGKQRRYERDFYESLVSEIMEKRPEGLWGHPDLAGKMSTLEHQPPALRWIGATIIEGTGEVWGKVIPHSSEAKDYLRIAEASKADVATSYIGYTTFTGEVGKSVDLRRIDLSPPFSPGIEDATSKVFVSEMEEEDMEPRIEELTAEIEGYQAKVTELEGQIEQLTAEASQLARLRELVGEQAGVWTRLEVNVSGDGDDLVKTIEDVIEKLRMMLAQNFVTEAEATIAEMVTLEDARPLIRDLLGLPDTADLGQPQLVAEMYATYPEGETSVRDKVKAIMEKPHVQTLLKSFVAEQAGPGAIVGGKQPDPAEQETKRRDKLAEEAKDVAREVGVNV